MRIGDKVWIGAVLVAVTGCGLPRAAIPDRSEKQDVSGERDQAIREVAWSAAAFNPSLGERVTLNYTLNQPGAATILLYDPDGGLVRTLQNGLRREAGRHTVLWDGRDEDGQGVPDEAYQVTIETDSGALYDPTTFSGGLVGDVTDAQFDLEAGTVTYALPSAARVLVRLGLHDGPMLKTLVDWKPRVAGTITEYWDSYDEDHLQRIHAHKGFTALITYATLPEATVTTYGNQGLSYRTYKLGPAKDRAQKPKRPRRLDAQEGLLAGSLIPPAWMRAPRLKMMFPSSPDQVVPEVQGTVDVRVDVDQEDRGMLLREQFEVIFFQDNLFVAEAERGYLPLNWRWELHQLPAGEHILTVNVSSFKGQVGIASRKVRVVSSP